MSHFTFVLHGVANRDPNELVCMWFPTLQEAQLVQSQFPGHYEIQMVEGVDYNAITVETVDRFDGDEGQDHESYTDDQDHESYVPDEDTLRGDR
jgi:hypothetical protein